MVRAGHVLFEFLPAGEMFNVAEAIVRVFHRLGDYQHKQRNRLKFLVKSLGWDGFREAFDYELEAFRATGGAPLPFDPERAPVEGPPVPSDRRAPTIPEILTRAGATDVIGPGIVPLVEPRANASPQEFRDWSRTNVRPQKQAGWTIVTVKTILGDLTSSQMRLVGELASAYGDGTVRVTADQNLVFRWVRSRDVELLYRSLHAAGLSRGGAGTLADVTSCPGAESCKLAVTQSRGLGRLLGDRLQQRPDLVAAVPGLDIKISGCPNGCGQHHIAGIGFQGSLRKVGGRPAPHYFVMVGGGVADGTTTFGRHAATIPARRCDEAIERLIALYRDQRSEEESAVAFFRRVDVAAVKGVLAGLDKLDPATASCRGLHRPCRGSRLPARGAGRGMQRVSAMLTPAIASTSVLEMIGRTPLLRLERILPPETRVEIYAKAEYLNPGGSVKDRAAAAILADGEAHRPPARRRHDPGRDLRQHRHRLRHDCRCARLQAEAVRAARTSRPSGSGRCGRTAPSWC